MATNTAATTARRSQNQLVHYARKRVLGAGGNATYNIVTLPAGANILRINTMASTVMSGGTPTVSFGTAASPAAFFAAAGAPLTTAGRNAVALIATGTLNMSADTVIVGVVAGTPTAGTVDFEIEYTVDNDN
ncbi:hypothetical protein [Mesorhizobium sp. URHB0026]